MPLLIEAHDASYRIENPGGLIGKSLTAGIPYEAKVLEHIYRKGLTGLALDVGASIGNHSLWFAAVCGLRVIAFEPLSHAHLRRNVALNPDLDITVWPIGLSDKAGRGGVTGPPAHVVGEDYPADGAVPLGRLDDFDLRDVILMKIDVEGMEPDVLRGSEETIRRERPVIFAEAESPAAHERNAEVLNPLGYEHVKTFGATPLEEWGLCR